MTSKSVFGSWAPGGALLVLLAGCGGKVLFDPTGGSGGAGTTSSETSLNTTTTTDVSTTTNIASVGSGTGCNDYLSSFQAALSKAQACNPTLNINQCSGMTVVSDACGCPTIVNDQDQTDVQAALAWRAKAESNGCLPICETPCDTDPFTGFCSPTSEGANGVCVSAKGI